MTPAMNEWEFTGDVVVWLNQLIAADPSLPFSKASTEQRGTGSQRRRDITILDRKGNPIVTGEIKLPHRPDGGSPFNPPVVKDALAKAKRAKVRYFFTWNVNQCVLWDANEAARPLLEQNYKTWKIARVHKPAALQLATTRNQIESWLQTFIQELAALVRDETEIGYRSPDQKFIETLEAALEMPIRVTMDALEANYTKTAFKKSLDEWMRGDQGWTIYTDPDGIRDNIERAAKFACYSLVIKLVFYEALLKRYGKRLKKIIVGSHIDRGDDLRRHLEGFFDIARQVTGDYETVFGQTDARVIGTRIPFYADEAVPHWIELIESIHQFDFSKLDYEVIGSIFERLIDPEERHKYGQHYTRVEVVDLINSFAIRRGDETVMDPACGGGTFLVRAYARKRELAPSRGHAALLADLFGVDVSNFATHLTTINLATRDLIDDENYPQISRKDFFDVVPEQTFVSLPRGIKARSLGKAEHRNIVVPKLDVVVGNPPYVRQEEIPKATRKGQQNTKDAYKIVVEREAKITLSGRSDLHVYFWPHAASFLKPEGYLGFLTSSQWLDVEYGFKLQRWILENFEIVAIMESINEPWFVGARVATVATILRRQGDAEKRAANLVRFVQLRKPVHDLLTHDGTTAGAMDAADQFRDELLGLDAGVSSDRFRCRLIPQHDLWRQGVALGALMAKTRSDANDQDDAEQVESSHSASTEAYYGGKWGVYLRAPDLWFNLTTQYDDRWALLGAVTSLRRGVTSGKDEFFFPRDRSEECLAEHTDAKSFELEYSVPRRLVTTGRVRIVAAGDQQGILMPIEASYLEPEVHSLMEIKGFIARPEDCARQILLVSAPKKDLRGTYVLEYIKWGERQGVNAGSTCAARATASRQWYDLTGQARGDLFWPMAQQYRHAVPRNIANLQANHNLFDITCPASLDPDVMAGVLNSTFVVLSKFQFGRPVGVEGNLKTEVVDTTMMLVPDPRGADPAVLKRVKAAFKKLMKRDALAFLSERRLRTMSYTAKKKVDDLDQLPDTTEMDMKDRHELDDAVLELLGEKDPVVRRQTREALYEYLRGFFESTRRKEEHAIANKNSVRRRSTASPADIAAEIVEEIATRHPRILKTYYTGFFDDANPFDTYDIPKSGEPKPVSTLFQPNGITFGTGAKAETIAIKVPEQVALVVTLARDGIRGYVRVPHDPAESTRLAEAYASFIDERDRILEDIVESRTNDEGLQAAIRTALPPLLLARSHDVVAAA